MSATVRTGSNCTAFVLPSLLEMMISDVKMSMTASMDDCSHGMNPVVKPRGDIDSGVNIQFGCGGESASRILPSICAQRCSDCFVPAQRDTRTSCHGPAAS